MLLYAGKIYTQDPNQPWADSLLIEHGKIIATGTYSQLTHSISAKHERINLQGRLVLPGFVDSHIHLELYAAFLVNVDCETPTRSQCLQAIYQRALTIAGTDWITGHGWNHNIWPEGIGNRLDLDAVTEGHPAYFTSKSVHSGWANTAALKLAGIDQYTQNPTGGVIERDAKGHPTGILLETAMAIVERVIPHRSKEFTQKSIELAQANLSSLGITTIHDFDQVTCLDALNAIHSQQNMKVRVVKGIPFTYFDEACKQGIFTGAGDDWLQFGSLKLFADGALGPQTASMLASYEGSSSSFGIANLTEKELIEIGTQAIQHKISVATHAIGDAANRLVVNAYAQYRQIEKYMHIPQLNHRIEHVQIIQPEDRLKLKQNDITASMQPIHATSDWKMADKYWGNRVNQSYAWKSNLDLGVRMIFGSDAPVESPNPFWGLHAAITRKAVDFNHPDGWCPEQKITLEQALQAYTCLPAEAIQSGHKVGKLAPGYQADLVVLDQNIFQVSPEQLRRTETVATMVEGFWTWKVE